MAAVVLNDFSPAISYTPSLRLNPSLDAADGWTALFDGQELQPGAEALGTPAHRTNLQGAALAIQFAGAHATPMLMQVGLTMGVSRALRFRNHLARHRIWSIRCFS